MFSTEQNRLSLIIYSWAEIKGQHVPDGMTDLMFAEAEREQRGERGMEMNGS